MTSDTTTSTGSTAPGDRRVALVTGASGGIGRAVAERLGADGMAVGVHYAGHRDRADEVAAAVRDAGGEAVVVGGDIGDVDAVTAMFDEVERAFGGLDVVVNTAGVMTLQSIAELDLTEGGITDRMLRTNLRGTLVVSQQAVRRVRSGGAVINFSTSVVRLSLPTYGAYVATKGAVEALTPVLAKELAGRDVTVNTVAPGPTATPLFLEGKTQQTIDAMAGRTPLGRIGEPSDIAETVAHLAGPARWVNGQVIYTNGGIA